MRVELLQPDVSAPTVPANTPDASAFGNVLNDVGAALDRATGAEDSYAAGHGSLQDAVYERAQADVALSVATAAAQRAAQAVQSILNMQI